MVEKGVARQRSKTVEMPDDVLIVIQDCNLHRQNCACGDIAGQEAPSIGLNCSYPAPSGLERIAIAYIGEGAVCGVHSAPLAPAKRTPSRHNSGARGHEPCRIGEVGISLRRELVQPATAWRCFA
jgi:hypothetical protein